MTEWQDASYNLYVPKAQYEAMKRRLTASNADLLQALKMCHLQMLQSNNDSEHAEKANERAIAAIAKAEGRP